MGLKTGLQLKTEGVEFNRNKIHPYIFFRAPYYSSEIDYTSVETEINSSYGEGQIGNEPRVFIRVDPDKTFVFSSEIRFNFFTNQEREINNSKKTLSEYLEIINNNININVEPDKKILYNLNSSKATLFPNKYKYISKFNSQNVFSQSPIEKIVKYLYQFHI